MAIDFTQIDTSNAPTTAARLALYYQAEANILLAGQGYTVAERQKQSAQLAEIRQAIRDLEDQLATEKSSNDLGIGVIGFRKA